MTLDDIKEVLEHEDIGIPVYQAVNKTDPPEDKYIVYTEEGAGGSFSADNKTHITKLAGTIDLFTRTDNDPKRKEVELKLTQGGIAWSFNSYQYEAMTEYNHYEWTFEVIASG